MRDKFFEITHLKQFPEKYFMQNNSSSQAYGERSKLDENSFYVYKC